jgi:ketosteroid isomerase-like protein
MMDRLKIDRLLRDLYAARVRGDLDAVCGSFLNDARFEIAGASHASPIAVTSVGVDKFRPLLALMIRTFKISDQSILSIIIEGLKAAVHWRATIHSRVTGTTVETELVDLIEVRDDHIASYIEFFVPRHRH